MDLTNKLKDKVRRFTYNSSKPYYLFNTIDGESVHRGMWLQGDHHKKITEFNGDFLYNIEKDTFEKW